MERLVEEEEGIVKEGRVSEKDGHEVGPCSG